ncbi:MAG: hypothetical protein KF770_01735 [Anaerolineae bacterium]|nr:hypothetical protein [Anaerolineae bacterium]
MSANNNVGIGRLVYLDDAARFFPCPTDLGKPIDTDDYVGLGTAVEEELARLKRVIGNQ